MTDTTLDASAVPAGADPARTRTFSWDDPIASARAATGMTGIDYLRAMARGDLPRPPISIALGFDGFEVDEGTATFYVTPAEYHYNPIGVVHGGLAATLFDSALGCAVHTLLPAGAGFTTIDLKVSYVRPLTTATGQVRCEAKVLHLGRRLATAEARLLDGDGRLYGHATATCMVFRPDEAGS